MIKELGYIPSQKKNRENPYDKCNFSYNKLKDEYICPEKKPLIFFKEQYDKTKKKIIRNYKGVNCGDCLKHRFSSAVYIPRIFHLFFVKNSSLISFFKKNIYRICSIRGT